MACSKYEYVKFFEHHQKLNKNSWNVIRIDGHGFSQFCMKHNMEKPNDIKCIELMNKAALEVMKNFTDIHVSYGQSDEYSFVFHRNTNLWNGRQE